MRPVTVTNSRRSRYRIVEVGGLPAEDDSRNECTDHYVARVIRSSGPPFDANRSLQRMSLPRMDNANYFFRQMKLLMQSAAHALIWGCEHGSLHRACPPAYLCCVKGSSNLFSWQWSFLLLRNLLIGRCSEENYIFV